MQSSHDVSGSKENSTILMHIKIEIEIEIMDKNLKGKEEEAGCTCVCIIRYLIMRTILKKSGRITASYSPPFPSPNILTHYPQTSQSSFKI